MQHTIIHNVTHVFSHVKKQIIQVLLYLIFFICQNLFNHVGGCHIRRHSYALAKTIYFSLLYFYFVCVIA